MNTTKEITVVAKDRIGLLADITETLSGKGLNIDTISAESSSRNAIIRILVKDPANAKKALEGAGLKVMDEDALVVGLSDKPGELAKFTRMLANNKINIESLFVMNREDADTVLAAIKVNNYDAARKLLREKKFI